MHKRNSKPLFNLNTYKYFTASDSTIHTVLHQMQRPMFNTTPIELGWSGNEKEMLERFNKDGTYKILFKKCFGSNVISLTQLQQAIAAYILSIESYNSNYDKYIAGNKNTLSNDEKAGMQLFFGNKLNCKNCHGGKNFDTPSNKEFYTNIGLYNVVGNSSYPTSDIGLMQTTKQPADMGKFKIPTLRNLQFTAPYYHDGSETSLMQVIKNYNSGGRVIKNGENAGNGITNKYKHKSIQAL